MSSPAWFFSTLAQSAAAVIGLTVAFTVSTHISRRERVNRKTERLREELIDFRNRYRDILFNMAGVFHDQAEFNRSYDVGKDLADGEHDRTRWAKSQPAPVTAEFWACFYGIAYMLTNVNDLDDLPDDQEFGRLREAVNRLQEMLRTKSDASEKFYEEITGTSADSSDPHYYHEDILEDLDRMHHWLRYTTNARRINTVTVVPDDDRLTGKNIFSLATMVKEMDGDSTDIAPLTADTQITDEFMSPGYTQRIIRTSGKLGIVGVLIPVALLISPAGASVPFWDLILGAIPNWVPNLDWVGHYTTIIIEVLLVLMSTILSYELFYTMLREVGHEPPSLRKLLADDAYWDEDDPKSQRYRAYIARITLGERIEGDYETDPRSSSRD